MIRSKSKAILIEKWISSYSIPVFLASLTTPFYSIWFYFSWYFWLSRYITKKTNETLCGVNINTINTKTKLLCSSFRQHNDNIYILRKTSFFITTKKYEKIVFLLFVCHIHNTHILNGNKWAKMMTSEVTQYTNNNIEWKYITIHWDCMLYPA